MSDTSSADGVSTTISKLEEHSLERMESLLQQSALGIHVLFENTAIASVYREKLEEKDFFDFDKMKKVQDVMTQLIAKKTYLEKMAYINELDKESFQMLVRTYFHIVENTVRSSQQNH